MQIHQTKQMMENRKIMKLNIKTSFSCTVSICFRFVFEWFFICFCIYCSIYFPHFNRRGYRLFVQLKLTHLKLNIFYKENIDYEKQVYAGRKGGKTKRMV